MSLRVPAGRPTLRAAGLLITGVGLGTAGAFTSREILVWFASILLALLAVVWGWTVQESVRDRRRALERRIVPAQLQVGRSARNSLTFAAARPPPLSRITDTVPRSLRGPGSETDRTLRPTRRGPVQLGPVFLHRSDPFGLFSWRSTMRRPDEVIVWPRTDAVPTEVFDRLRALTLGAVGSPAPEIDDLSLREYRHGDPLSRIHWKRTAQHGTLLVRQDDPGRTTHFDLLLLPGPAGETDTAVDTLAAAAANLTAPETTLRLLTPGIQVTGELPAVLTALAHAAPAEPALPTERPRGIVVAALATATEQAAAALAAWLTAGELDPEAVFIFPAAPLPPPARERLRAFTVVTL